MQICYIINMIRFLAAIDEKRGLAKGDKLPWSIPSDVRRYQELMKSKGGNILVGRKTYEQMSAVLDGLNVFIATRSYNPTSKVIIVEDVKDFLRGYDLNKDIWVIGGAKVFEEALEFADELWLTEIEGDYDCDVFFPEYKDAFVLSAEVGTQEENGYKFHYRNYVSVK